ncbi:CGI99 [Lepeophtheirus salmonis]|uniref:CGI99 n=1 Tax=Lepeophtheirus salmonis TaxID=72036 RepID=A0A7R8CMU2_LEPSM|nr:CGI99 [Lepeophtheirus salmonis]CAF2868785.1 CGI99 [Lepeophtheirus salmonis]
MQVFQRRLKALAYPKDFNIEDEASVKDLVSWLESNKFQKIPDGPDRILSSWPTSFGAYLKEMGCHEESNLHKQIIWLLSTAIQQDYKELRYRLPDPSTLSLSTQAKDNEQKAFTDTVDLESEELKKAVNEFASKIKMAQHPDHLVTLEACCKYIIQNVALKNISSKEGNVLTDIQSNSLGLQDIKDPVVLTSAKILRLLHISSLRDLQNKINQVIVKIQGITANPKTDTTLGKVGR